MSKRVSILLPGETDTDPDPVRTVPRRGPAPKRDLERNILLSQYQAPGTYMISRGSDVADSTPRSSTDDQRATPKRVAKHPRSERAIRVAEMMYDSNSQSNKSSNQSKSSIRDSLSGLQEASKISFNIVRSNTPTFTLVSSDEPDLRQRSMDDKEPQNSPCNCPRFDESCNCCHCSHMKLAQKQAAFLQSPEGQHRQEMKLLAKNFFMDICAMSEVRKQILNTLHGTQQDHPSSRVSYPVSLSSARILDSNSLVVQWYIHDHSDIDYYLIFVDNRLAKRVYNVQSTETILIDLDPHKTHQLRMRAVPYKGRGSKADPMDTLALDLCAGRKDKVMKGDYFCKCGKGSNTTKAFYKRNKCKSLIDFWNDSEFLYMPSCRCSGTSACQCYMEECEALPPTSECL